MNIFSHVPSVLPYRTNSVFKFCEKGTVNCVHLPGHDVKIHVL